MNKKEILKVLDIASLVSIAIATVLMFIFQFNADINLVRYSAVLYVASFLMLSVFYSLKVYFAFSSKTKDDVEFAAEKKQKALLITKLVLAVIAFILTLVILIIFKQKS